MYGVAFSIGLLLGSHIFGFLGGIKILAMKLEMYHNVCKSKMFYIYSV